MSGTWRFFGGGFFFLGRLMLGAPCCRRAGGSGGLGAGRRAPERRVRVCGKIATASRRAAWKAGCNMTHYLLPIKRTDGMRADCPMHAKRVQSAGGLGQWRSARAWLPGRRSVAQCLPPTRSTGAKPQPRPPIPFSFGVCPTSGHPPLPHPTSPYPTIIITPPSSIILAIVKSPSPTDDLALGSLCLRLGQPLHLDSHFPRPPSSSW